MSFKVFNESFSFSTKREFEFLDLTDRVLEAVSKSGVKDGLVHVFAPHATGILILTENEQELLNDLRRWLENVVPKSRDYGHPSNAHSHLRSVLLSPERTLPVVDGRVQLGTWQSLMFVETDVYPRTRTVVVSVLGQT